MQVARLHSYVLATVCPRGAARARLAVGAVAGEARDSDCIDIRRRRRRRRREKIFLFFFFLEEEEEERSVSGAEGGAGWNFGGVGVGGGRLAGRA